MGNQLPRPMLDPPGDTGQWQAYTQAQWRSARVRELDALGGLARPPLIRGASFQKKLEYLGSLVGGRADAMQGLFEQFDTAIKQIGTNLETKTRLSGSDANDIKGLISLTTASGEVAAWRLRIHAARRRLILTVWVAARFQTIVKRPSRLRRVDSFSYMIPDFLGQDAHKFVEEQIKYSEAVRQEQSGSDEDREDGEVQEDEAEGREHRSPGSGPPRQLQGMPTAFATPAAALGRQQPQHVPGPGSQSSMASPEKLRPQTQATKRAVPGAGIMGGPAKLNFYRPFQTYKRLENLIPAEPAPLPKRGAGHAISSVAGAVPPLTYRVSAARPDSPRGKVKVRPLSHEHPARQGRHHPNRSPPGKAAKVPPPATPQLAFVSEGLRLPSIAAMTGTATRPLRHKSSLVQHWITEQGSITCSTAAHGITSRASYSGGFSFLPLGTSDQAVDGDTSQHPPSTPPGLPGSSMLPRLQRASSPGAGAAAGRGPLSPSLGTARVGALLNSPQHAEGAVAPPGLSVGPGLAWGAGLSGSGEAFDEGSHLGGPAGGAGTSNAVGSHAAPKRHIMFADSPRSKGNMANAHSPGGLHNAADGQSHAAGEMLLPASSSEPLVLAQTSSPQAPSSWAQGSSATPALRLAPPYPNFSAVPKPPWGPLAQHGQPPPHGQTLLAASSGQQVGERDLAEASGASSKGGTATAAAAGGGDAQGARVLASRVSFLNSSSPGQHDVDDGASSVASGRSVATSVFSVYNSEYQFGESVFDEEGVDVDDALLLDPAYWRLHAEEHPSSHHEQPPQSSVPLPGQQGDGNGPDTALRGAGSFRHGSWRRTASRGIQWRNSDPTAAEASEAPAHASLQPEVSQEVVMPFVPVRPHVVLRPGLSQQVLHNREGTYRHVRAAAQEEAAVKRQAKLLARSMERGRDRDSAAAGAAGHQADDVSEEESDLDRLDVAARCKMMMRMYVNRCNAAWAEHQGWSKPTVRSLAEHKMWQSSVQGQHEAKRTLQAIRTGKVAFWFLAGEDNLPAARSESTASFIRHDIWSSDPYTLIRNCRPGLLHGKQPLTSHSYQSRALGQLALAVTAAGGKLALQCTCIILHINDEQQAEVTRELWDYKFYGFERENCIIVMQPKRPGYRYDPVLRCFVAATGVATHPETTGTGLAAMQLSWCPDAYILSADGTLEPLPATALEVLSDRGVEHLLCHRARDMAVLDRERVLDLAFLAQGRWLHSSRGHNMATQVLLSDSMTAARSLNSVVLTLEAHGTNAEMRMGEMSSHALSKAIAAAKAANGGKISIGLQRYLFHLPSLKAMMSSNKHFRPRLRLHDGLLFVSFDIANVTSLPSASLAAVQVANQPPLLLSRKELPQLLETVERQDADDMLMNLLDSLQPPQLTTLINTGDGSQSSDAPLRLQPPWLGVTSRSNTVVFVDGNLSNLAAVRMALALTRPGRHDTVHLVMFVAAGVQVAPGHKRLARLQEHLGSHSQGLLRVEVLVRGVSSLLGAMKQYVAAVRAELVVIPSATLGRPGAQNVLGSVALAILKVMEVPVLLVTPRCSPAAETLLERRQLRMMVMADAWAMPLVEFAGDRILVPSRGDRLVLGQVFSSRTSTRRQIDHGRWHMAVFRDHLATKRSFTNVEDLIMDGIYNEVVLQTIIDSKISLLGVHLPQGVLAVPKGLITLLCSSQAAVLVMKRKMVPTA